MQRDHEKALEQIFRISGDRKMTLSKKVVKRIEEAERRSVNINGRHIEFPYDVLISLTIDIPYDQATQPVAVISPKRLDYSKINSKEKLMKLIAERIENGAGIHVPSQSADVKSLRSILAKDDERVAREAAERKAS